MTAEKLGEFAGKVIVHILHGFLYAIGFYLFYLIVK